MWNAHEPLLSELADDPARLAGVEVLKVDEAHLAPRAHVRGRAPKEFTGMVVPTRRPDAENKPWGPPPILGHVCVGLSGFRDGSRERVLVGVRGHLSQVGVASPGVVADCPAEDLAAARHLVAVGRCAGQGLAFERSVEGLREGVVSARSHGTEGLDHAELSAELGVVLGGVDRPVVGVEDRAAQGPLGRRGRP